MPLSENWLGEKPAKEAEGDDKELGVGIGGKQIVFPQRSGTF